jgi:integrase
VKWQQSVGDGRCRVTVYERPDGKAAGILYLKWREDGEWRRRSLRRRLRAGTGRILKHVEEWALGQAREQLRELLAAPPTGQGSPLTVAQGFALVCDRHRGRWPVDTTYRREVQKALAVAKAIWGADRPLVEIQRADYRALWRARIESLGARGHRGHRGAEITLARVVTAMTWLRDEGYLKPGDALHPRRWKDELRADWRSFRARKVDPQPERPRYTLEQMRQILEAARELDPRFALLMVLGAELRLGQVVRCRRTDLELEAGKLRVPGAGTKKGTTVKLTEAQRADLLEALGSGYLRELEREAGDYPLFPGGQLPGQRQGRPMCFSYHRDRPPLSRRQIHKLFVRAELAAGIEHVEGRATYGIRRAAVDAAKRDGVSREGLKAFGGWTDQKVADAVYAEQEQEYAREEASRVRARIRGESGPPTDHPEAEDVE